MPVFKPVPGWSDSGRGRAGRLTARGRCFSLGQAAEADMAGDDTAGGPFGAEVITACQVAADRNFNRRAA